MLLLCGSAPGTSSAVGLRWRGPQTSEDVNVFRELLASIEGGDSFDFLFLGLARLLNNVHEALNTTLPGSLAQIDCIGDFDTGMEVSRAQ